MDKQRIDSFSQRKQSHIDLAVSSQLIKSQKFNLMNYFNYEPMVENNLLEEINLTQKLFDKSISYPFLISSMTASGEKSQEINTVLAQVAKRFNIPFALGSCRRFLMDDRPDSSMLLREHLGEEVVLFANLGIAQIEELMVKGELGRINLMMDQLQADALYVHVNPLQELFQAEGDRYQKSPVETIAALIEVLHKPVFVKEVGQGFGPESLQALLSLPIAGIDSASLGGTNFTHLEKLRTGAETNSELPYEMNDNWDDTSRIGHTTFQMVKMFKTIQDQNKVLVVSGGVRTAGQAFFCKEFLNHSHSLVGMAYPFLKAAEQGLEQTIQFFEDFLKEYLVLKKFLKLKSEYK